MLEKEYVRDGRNQITGSITNGFSDESSLVRDSDNQISGRTSDRFTTTRDRSGDLASINSSEPGLLIHRKK
jgi:hypothetical protein